MPLDKAKARARVDGARNAYRIGIRADFIQLLADDLDEALKLLDGQQLDVVNAKNEAARYGRELDAEKTAYRELRERSAHTESAIAVLREIAKHGKGAQKKAADMLEQMGVKEAVPVVTKVEVP